MRRPVPTTPYPYPHTAVLIGRWQILHKGHVTLLREALAVAPQVIIVLGSAGHSRDARNPFTWEERQQQFELLLTEEERSRVVFLPIRDYYDHARWRDAVRAGVARLTNRADQISIVGFKKDRVTAEYLDLFPGWSLREVEPAHDISATDLRRIYFETQVLPTAMLLIGNYVEPAIVQYLTAWAKLPAYRQCALEHRAVTKYREEWTAPFYLTADSVVTASDHVLLIRRGGANGTNLWALPGGFLDPQEQFYPAAVRELREETGFAPLPDTLDTAFRGQTYFDHPGRSARGRIITVAFHFDFGSLPPPDVEGRDDAREARWVPIRDLLAMDGLFFEDHLVILDHVLGIFPSV